MTQQLTALITGGAMRIGRAISEHLHNEGYSVAIHYRNSAEEANAIVARLNNIRPLSAVALQADLTNLTEIKRLAQAFAAQFGRCALLVNNASSFYPSELGTISEQIWDDLFASNAKAPLFISQELLPLFSEGASIINIADIHAERPLKNHTVYCMAKAANCMLTQSLALELAPKVRVNGIAPGAILPPSGATLNIEKALENVPMQTLGGEQAVCEAVWYLVNASYVTGQIINVDGGRTLRQ